MRIMIRIAAKIQFVGPWRLGRAPSVKNISSKSVHTLLRYKRPVINTDIVLSPTEDLSLQQSFNISFISTLLTVTSLLERANITTRYIYIYCKLSAYALSDNGKESWKMNQDPRKKTDRHQNLNCSSLGHTLALHKISSKSVHSFLRYFTCTETDIQTAMKTVPPRRR